MHSHDTTSNDSHNKLQRLNGNIQNVTQFSRFPWMFFFSKKVFTCPKENTSLNNNVHCLHCKEVKYRKQINTNISSKKTQLGGWA